MAFEKGILVIMPLSITESDWKVFKRIHAELLEVHCRETLQGTVKRATQPNDKGAHDKYLALYEYIMERDQDLGAIFNDYRRSSALRQLRLMRRENLLTDAHLKQFSEQVQSLFERINTET